MQRSSEHFWDQILVASEDEPRIQRAVGRSLSFWGPGGKKNIYRYVVVCILTVYTQIVKCVKVHMIEI